MGIFSLFLRFLHATISCVSRPQTRQCVNPWPSHCRQRSEMQDRWSRVQVPSVFLTVVGILLICTYLFWICFIQICYTVFTADRFNWKSLE